MGIRGLQTFMEHEVENGTENICLSEIAQSYRRKTGEDPVMFYEAPSSIVNFVEESSDLLEILCCGNLKKYKKKVEIFINNVFELGVNLKVVSDGRRHACKHQVWIDKHNRLVEILENLYSTKSVNFDIKNARLGVLNYYLVANLVFQTSDKCEYIRGIHAADEHIINYVKKFNCFAVLSNNSNFILTEGAEYCLSSKNLDLDTMTTTNYNRKNLAKHLNISTSQLPLFGSLLLSKQIECPLFFNKSKKYKKNKSNHGKNKFKEMSELVKELPSGEEILQNKVSDCQKFLQLDRKGLSMWTECLKFYSGSSELDPLLDTNSATWEEILAVAEKRHVKGVMSIIYEVLSQQKVYLYPNFSNVLKPMPGSALLPLRKKMYGILFLEYPYSKISVTEYCYEYCEKILKAKFVCNDVKFQRIKHPGLLQLWSPFPSENIKEEKRRVFCEALDKKFDPNDIEDIEEELLFPFLASFYLFWISEIKFQEFEIKIFLIHAILVNSLSEEETEKYCTDEDGTDFDVIELCSWFINVVQHLNYLNFACGEPFCLQKTNLVNYFDGRILNYVYKNEKNEQNGTKNIKAWPLKVWGSFTFLNDKLDQIGRKCRFYKNKRQERTFIN